MTEMQRASKHTWLRLVRRLLGLIPRWLLAAAALSLATACTTGSNDLVPRKDMVGAPISAVGHYGSMIGVPEFYLNGRSGGTASGWGGGGATVCCMLLPRKVTGPVMVKVNWTTCDISDIKFVNGRAVDPSQKCKEEEHEETVPVNFAVQPGEGGSGLFVHFLPGNHVEVWYSTRFPEASGYPGPVFPRGPAPDYAPLPDKTPQRDTSSK
ncbi:DUF3304 domain-containing protein [Variovorax sp. ZS18.2.2]|uniref:DUF3304 domain-containing protein n=1 Tax=Variovorax sp. ZS18.2.2 TaxID=2971255 RepID=UPI002150EB87|nr:DUF3304 domain-containing protein [Variovorax sp. ZS18.2.2]MCR6480029.1 DUF3304 domain-containing protein [Variovorax sp. ZS18.2.2]